MIEFTFVNSVISINNSDVGRHPELWSIGLFGGELVGLNYLIRNVDSSVDQSKPNPKISN